ncbi:hypothetical protein IP88_05335 [alpha proteobacterium AAP81b]|nr:hypothetical protein IP88_05335 [alpha proteobacterium AAP81b]
MRLTIDHSTANGALMLTPAVIAEVTAGIDNPSDARITAETSLYRVAHKQRYDRASASFVANDAEAGLRSPWWTTNYFFNAAVWANDDPDMPGAARQAFAIHPAWRSDCSNYASIYTRCDLSVWYGLGKTVTDVDPATGATLAMPGSAEVLQIYIPGFRENFARWGQFARVIAFESSLGNGRGFQGNPPAGLRPPT